MGFAVAFFVDRGNLILYNKKYEGGDIMVGSKVKKMYILAILAIIFIFIMHIISWVPVVQEANKVRDDWRRHNIKSQCLISDNCEKCEYYDEKIALYDKEGAELWQNTVADCVLIALAGSITYVVGAMAEKKQEDTNCIC